MAAAAGSAMPTTTTTTSSSSSSQSLLHMDVQAEEDDVIAAVGYTHERYPHLCAAELAVSPRVGAAAVAEHVRMLFMFSSLASLQLRFDFDDIAITQTMVRAIAELLPLTSLQLLHGTLDVDVDVSYLSSLRSLAELKLLPGQDGGLGDAQLEQLTALSTSLTCLAVRLNPEATTPAGLWQLSGLRQLRRLSVCPLPEGCSASELSCLLHMPGLDSLQLGTANAAQVLAFTELQQLSAKGPRVSLLVREACEPGPAADVLTVISWQLPQCLTRLAIGPLAAASPGDVLVTLATLTRQAVRPRLCRRLVVTSARVQPSSRGRGAAHLHRAIDSVTDAVRPTHTRTCAPWTNTRTARPDKANAGCAPPPAAAAWRAKLLPLRAAANSTRHRA